jgi:nicotinate-nucleotide pyrophosphorylase (carboxylating)
VREAVGRALAEDLGPLGDLTAALLPPGVATTAHLVPRAAGVLAGRRAASEAFARVDPSVSVGWAADDGDVLAAGTPIASVEGPLASVLTAERTALNFLGHLSGVATLTRRYVDLCTGTRAVVRDTRKTTPGLRALEKAAVRAGGAANHRGSLSDGVLLKDNHLAGTPIAEAVARARTLWPGRAVQVECDTDEQVDEALAARADLVLLDNMAPDQVAACVRRVRASSAGRCLVEVSGGVTLETVAAYARAGADLISVGALTHSAPVLDIGLDLGLDVAPENTAPVGSGPHQGEEGGDGAPPGMKAKLRRWGRGPTKARRAGMGPRPGMKA